MPRPRSTFIGLRLALPVLLLLPIAAAAPAAAHTSGGLAVTNVDSWTDLAGDTHVTGLIQNHTSTRRSNIQVTATWTTPAATETATAFVANLAPHAASPFHVVEDDTDVSAAGDPAVTAASLLVGAGPAGGLHLDLEGAALVGDAYTISITNDAAMAASDVVVWALRSGGSANDAAGSPPATLAPGAGADFTIEFNDESEGSSITSVIATTTSGTFVTSWNNYFGDLGTSNFAAEIGQMADMDITFGCGSANYCPKDVVTRAQMAAFLDRAIVFDDESAPDQGFTDIGHLSPAFQQAINNLAAAGVTGGCTTVPKRYCPGDTVTRGQMSKFIVTAYELGSAITADQFTDDDGHFSEPYNDRMAELGITNGCATNPDRYCPHNPVLREQMAVFIVRAELLTLNAAPVVDNSGGSASFTEGAVPVAIDSAVTVADADGGNLASGRVQLTGGCQPGEDVLALVAPPPGITVSAYVPATCTLDLTGPASIAAFQTALRGVTYTNSSDNPSTLSRTATFSVNDGAASGSDIRTITVTVVNDAPMIGLSVSAPSYTEDGPAVTVDGGLTVADPDNTNLASGSVTVSAGGQAGDALTFTPGATGIIDTNAAADVLTLTGTTTVANWQTVLRSVQFSTTNQNPTTSRTIRFVVNDGLAASTNADKTVAVVPVSEPPVLTQPDAGTLSYTEGDAATPVAPNITAADVDSATFVGATIDVGTGYVNGQDVLSLGTNPQNGISAAFDATTGTLTLSGTANPAQYQTALRDVRFANTSDDPTGGVRNITFQVTDGDAGSNTVSRNVNVVPVNDAPTADDETFSGASGAIGNTTLVVNDPDDGAPSTPDPTDTGPVTNRPHKTISGDILTGDTDPDGPALTVTPGVFPTSDGGTVTLEGDGDFTFEPAPATSCADASDFFDYTVSDGAVPTPGTDTGRVTISVIGCVWYVNNDDGQGNSGTAEKPFDTLAQAETASSAGHTIFIYDGNNTTTGYAAGINLKANQKLVGEAAPLTIGSDTLHSADAANRPTITDTNADVVDLDDGNEVRGVSIDPAGAGGGIAGSSGDTGGGTIDDVSITDVTPFGTQPGLELDSTTGTYAISNITVSTTDATGVRLNASGTVTFAAAGLVTITTAGAKGLDVTNTNLGTSTVDTISVTGSTSGALSLTTTSGTTTFGLLALTTTGGTTPAFQLANAGTVTVTNGASTLASTTAAALDVANTTIGAAGLTFRSISSNGAVNGIVLNSTGSSGGLTVTGDGSAGTGGTIQSSTGPGILLTSTSAPSFSFMAIQNGADDGIRGSGVTGFTLASSSVTNNGNATGESGLEFSGLVGTASISSSTIAGSPENGMVVTNSSGSLSLVVNESTLNSTSTLTSGNDGLQLAANDTASMTVTVAGSTFSDNRGDHFQFGTNATSVGSNSVTFSNNTLIGDRGSAYGGTDLNAGIVISPDGSADTSYTISQNNVQGAVSHAIAVAPGTSSTAGSLTSGTISTNTIGTALTADSGSAQGSGIAAYAQGDGIHTVRIENNQVRQWTGTAGIDVQIREGSASLNATITGNTVANPGTLGGSGLHGTAGGLATDDGTMCASITGNTMAGSAGAGGVSDFRVRQRFFTTVRLPGYAGLAGDTAAVVAFVQGNNPGAETGSATANFPLGGGGFVGGAACATP